jgi:hypothetical protein
MHLAPALRPPPPPYMRASRRGSKGEWVANDIVQTTIEEFRNGDPGLLEIFREIDSLNGIRLTMTTLRSAIADELDKRAQEFMSRHEVTYIQALRAVLPEESLMSKYTTATAGVEVDRRAARYLSEHSGSTYKEALGVVLKSDKDLAEAYGQPAARQVRMATTDKHSQTAAPVSTDVEREIKDWITRALETGMAGSLPGALGQLSIEADSFRKIGMPIEEAARRAMDSSPSLVSMARLLLVDIRRSAPENKPSEDTLAQDTPAGFEVHVRAEKLMQKCPHMDYREAVGVVLSEDTQLKVRYAGVQS